MIDADTLRDLLDEHSHALSLYLSLDPGQRDARAPADRLRQKLREADSALERAGVAETPRRDLLAGAEELASGIDFARHRDPGLALFVAPGRRLLVDLPEAVAECVVAGRHFHIKPLLGLVARNRRFHLLAVSAGQARLYEATPFALSERRLALPAGQPAAGSSDTPTPRHPPLLDHLRQVADAVATELGSDPAPVLLAAEPEAAGHFRKLADLPRLEAETLHVNPFALSPADLHRRAVDALRPAFTAEAATVLDQIRARLGTAEPTVAIRLEEIVAAAAVGRVDVVVVAEDEDIWGTFDAKDGTVTGHGTLAGGDEDLLNLAALLTLRTGGRALSATRAELPRGAPAAAALRY